MGDRPSSTPIRWFVGLAVAGILAGCTSGEDAGWVMEVDDAGAAGPIDPVTGTFGDPFIDGFLGPEKWDPADGAPPGYAEWTNHSTLIAFGELNAGSDDAVLRIDEVAKGDVADLADLAALDALPEVPSFPVEVAILVGPDEDGRPNLLVEPTEANRSLVVDALLGGGANAVPEPPLGELVAQSDVVLHGLATGNAEGPRVEVEVIEVFTGDADDLGELVWIDVGVERVGRTSASGRPAGVWFAAASEGELVSTSSTYPGGRKATITDYLRSELSGR